MPTLTDVFYKIAVMAALSFVAALVVAAPGWQ
jgi:hypothetical protein